MGAILRRAAELLDPRHDAERTVEGAHGLPRAAPGEERAARWVALLATVWIAAVALWESAGPVLAGHYASNASMGIIADNMLTHGILAPVWSYTAETPEPAAYYCHHPWGIFWVTALLRAVLGRSDLVCRLPAILLSIATPPLLYALGRALYRPLAGAVAAVAFVSLPIVLSFAAFNALEVPVIAWSTALLWAWVRHGQTGERRYLRLGLGAAALALHADWPAYVLAAGLLALDLPAVRRDAAARARFVALAALSLLTGGFYLGLFWHLGQLGELLWSAGVRAEGATAPLGEALDARAYWVALTFTPLAVALGKVGALVVAARAWARRSRLELLPLTVLGMSLFQLLVFRQGADLHVFWPHHFALFFALACAAIAASVVGPLAVLAAHRGRAGWGHRAALAVMLLLCAPILRDAVPALVWARDTGGRFDEKGRFLLDDGDRVAALRWLATTLDPDVKVGLHESMQGHWGQVWALGGREVVVDAKVGDPTVDVIVVDGRFARPGQIGAFEADRRVVAVGPILAVERPGTGGDVTGFSFVERTPSFLERAFVSSREPMRSVRPDDVVAWHVARAFARPPVPPELPGRGDRETMRVAHALALDAGDREAAMLLQINLRIGLSGPFASLEGGTEVLGVERREGPGARAVVYVLAGELPGGTRPAVRARVVQRGVLSISPPDPKAREVAPPTFPRGETWQAGRIYAVPFDLHDRPGTERFDLAFVSRNGRVAVRFAEPPGTSLTLFER